MMIYHVYQHKKRFLAELRPLVPQHLPMEVFLPEEPELYAWRGAARFAADKQRAGCLAEAMVTAAQYQERGHHYCNEKFQLWHNKCE